MSQQYSNGDLAVISKVDKEGIKRYKLTVFDGDINMWREYFPGISYSKLLDLPNPVKLEVVIKGAE